MIAVAAFCGLAALFGWVRPSRPPPAPLTISLVTGRRTPFEAALREAKGRRLRAIIDAPVPMSSREERNPTARRQQIRASSPGLRKAREAALRALKLARNPHDTFQTLQLLANIDCDMGDHKAELQTARRLVALVPQSGLSWSWLQRAARDNGLELLERQATAALKRRRNDADDRK